MADHAARAIKSMRTSATRGSAAPVGAGRGAMPSGHARPPLPASVGEMSQRFGEDFSTVRLHQDAQAHASAEALQARAYTHGEDIVWGRNTPPPDSHDGKRTLAHELAHVVQQRRGGPPPVQSPQAAHEVGADRAADAAVSGTGAIAVAGATGVGVARQPIDPRHARGYSGEQAMGFEQYPSSDGWVFVEGPSGAAGHNATAPGFDGVAYNTKTGELHIVDNKSFKRTGNVHSATAITKNLGKNLNDLIAKVEAMPKKSFPHKAKVLSLLKQTRDALAAGKSLPAKSKLIVTGSGGRSTGVSQRLKNLGVEFRDVSAPPSKATAGKGATAASPPAPITSSKASPSKASSSKASSSKVSSPKGASKSAAKPKQAAKSTAAKPTTGKNAATAPAAAKTTSPKAAAAQAKPAAKGANTQGAAPKTAAAKPTAGKKAATAPAAAKATSPKAATAKAKPAAKGASTKGAAPTTATPKTAASKPVASKASAGSKSDGAKTAAKKGAAPSSKGVGPKGVPVATPKAGATKGASPKATQSKAAPPKATTPKAKAKTSTAKPSAPKAAPPKPTAPKTKASTAKPSAPKAPPPKATTPEPMVSKPSAPKSAAAKPALPEPFVPKPSVAKPGAKPGVPAPKGGGPSVAGGALSIALPMVMGWLHGKAVEKRIDKQSDEKGFVPHNAPSGEGLAYDLGAWLLDPMRDAEKNVSSEKRFKISPWRQKVRNVANATPPGGTFDFTWEDPYCGQDLFGNPEAKYDYRKVTYKKGADGRLSVESGDASGVLDLNDVISEEISDQEIDGRIPRISCGGGGEA